MFSRPRDRLPRRLVVVVRCKFRREASCPLLLSTLCKRGEGFNTTPISPITRPFSCREHRRKNNVSNVSQRCETLPLKRSAMDYRPRGHRSRCLLLTCFQNVLSMQETLHNVSSPPCAGLPEMRYLSSWFKRVHSPSIFRPLLSSHQRQCCIHSTAHLHFLRVVIGL